MLANIPESDLGAVPPSAGAVGTESTNASEVDQAAKAHQKSKAVKRGVLSAAAFIFMPLITLAIAIALWGGPHHLWNWAAWSGVEAFAPFDYITSGWGGRAFELVFAVTCAVQMRWIGNCIAPNMQKNLAVKDFFALWLFDTLNTPFISWILIVLLQGLTITFAGGIRLSLAEADAALFGALSALLGMSVRETRGLLSRITTVWFKRLDESKSTAIG